MLANEWEKHQDKSDRLPPSPPPRIDDKELADILRALKKYAGFSGMENQTKVERLIDGLREKNCPEEWIQRFKSDGEKLGVFYSEAERLGRKNKPTADFDNLVKQTRKQLWIAKSEIEKGREKYEKALNTPTRNWQATNRLKKELKAEAKKNNFAPVSTDISLNPAKNPPALKVNHPNAITGLSPSQKWEILFDETGSQFNNAYLQGTKTGKVVALLVPEYAHDRLPDLENWHAVDKGLQQIKEVVDNILKSQCGLIGIDIASLNTIDSEQWFAGIETLLDFILRLIPVKEDTEIKLSVEQRGAYNKDDTALNKICQGAIFHLSRVFPGKAGKIKLSGSIIAKDNHKWNGYVDTAANVWGGKKPELLKYSGWQGTCFLGREANSLRGWLDMFVRETSLPPDEWSNLVTVAGESDSASLVKSLSDNIGNEAYANPALWQKYCDFVLQHLNSKAIDMRKLSLQVQWLSKWCPDENKLPPKLKLYWLTIKLAEANHRGEHNNFSRLQEEFEQLSLKLFEEDAPLTCNAALHLAVSYTNSFEFDKAKLVLAPWLNRPPEVPGLKYYGQILSSFGQLEAFTGNNAKAEEYLKTAINKFKQLSDRRDTAAETSQSTAYLITAMMDNTQTNENELLEILTSYLGNSIEEVIHELSGSIEASRKYHHHILLRYLCHTNTAPELIRLYRNTMPTWKISEGHPWELIEFYRGIICENKDERLEHFDRAYNIAITGGLTMQVIATVFLGAIYYYNRDDAIRKQLSEKTEEIIAKLDSMGNDRIAALRRQIESPVEPLELIKVLPFNFR